MAKIIFNDKEIELLDNSEINDACEELGVEFGCKNGFCRMCEMTVVEGYDNLSPITENEKFMDLKDSRRLMCQCKIKSGTVKIKSD